MKSIKVDLCLTFLFVFLNASYDVYAQNSFYDFSLKKLNEIFIENPNVLPQSLIENLQVGNEFIPQIPISRIHSDILTEKDFFTIRNRISQPQYKQAWTKIHDSANKALENNFHRFGSTESFRDNIKRNAQDAKTLAFVFRVTGQKIYLEKCLEALKNIPEPPKPGITNNIRGALDTPWGMFTGTSEALGEYLFAFQLVKNEIPEPLKSEA